ncbi:MAG: hypothetical protein WB998_12405 [Solirubrobacteraceae bacterium]
MAMSDGVGWELSASNYPTNFVQGVDEVQEVTASAETGTFTLSFKGAKTQPLPVHASVGEVQSALEGLSSIGSSDVVVSGLTPGTYSVMFVGALGSMKVAELGAAGATITTTTEGSSSGTIGVNIFNVGAAGSSGTITVTDTLPHGLKAKEAGELYVPGYFGSKFGIDPVLESGVWDCAGNGPGPSNGVAGATVVSCTNDPVRLVSFAGGGGTGTIGGSYYPQPALGIAVEVEPSVREGTMAGAEANHISIAGGGASEGASTVDPIAFGSTPAQGGLVQADAWLSNADGSVDRQAGSHPYTATFIYTMATALKSNKRGYLPSEMRNLETRVPPGLVGDLHSITQCTRQQLFTTTCPPASMIGRLSVNALSVSVVEQVFNMVPPPGIPAELGFNYGNVPVYIKFEVKTGGDYAIVAHVDNVPKKEIYQSILTLWGVPEESSHNIWRYGTGGCGPGAGEGEMEGPTYIGADINYCRVQSGQVVTPFLRLPTLCGEPQPYAFRELNGWQDPNHKSEVAFVSHDAQDYPAGFTGCTQLAFEPAMTTAPDTAKTDTPTGLSVEVKPPLGGLQEPGLLGSSDIQNTTVELPAGVVINPGQAAGLQACGSVEAELTTEAEKAEGKSNDGPAECPNASKIGTVSIKTPLLEADEDKQFEGNVYVLQSNPPELRLLIAASADGVNLKLVGKTSLCEKAGEVLNGKTCEAPGQIMAAFDNTPQVPFTAFKLSFSGGAQAALDTPTQCGTYASQADFTPWASPFIADFDLNSNFTLTEGPDGAPCPSNPLPFAPTLTAGATTDQAGGFTSFSMLLRRGDGQQRIEKLQFKIPRGLAGMISQVPLCDEADANAGTCPAASHIGHATVTSGPGPYPLVIPQPGEPEAPIYLTGPYKGAPFGLAIVTPVIAGPFNLGTIVTRASIAVDPDTAQITVTTDPLPQIVKGVPTDLREVDAVIDRPGFMFNPTNCSPQSFSGTATSSQGTQAAISSPFGMGSCQSLKFNPKFTVSTSGKTSRANGASLTAKVSYPTTPQGTQADISSVKVSLPKQLPSRLSTLQKACTSAQFDANPAGCPAASKIGYATVDTQLLPVPLTGPAIFVSHGGEAFPSLTIVLQGDKVTVNLVGTTFINKAGITSTTFKSVPDVPFKTFTLTLPEGKYSALAANGNLCKLKLKMPTIFNAQNGLTIKQSTPIAVTGCAKHKTKTKVKKKGTKKK